MKLGVALLLLFASTLDRKFTQIESDRLKPGTRIVMTAGEWNTYAREQVQIFAPKGVRNVHVELGEGSASASALINFLEVEQAKGSAPNFLLAGLLNGERPVSVTVRIQSREGQARVDVERVTVSGISLEGRALDFLIRQYVIPRFPDAKVGQWFPLEHHMDHFEIHPPAVTVVIGK